MTAKRILIVEDEKAIRDMVAFGLRRAGYEVREAEDCREARARIVDVRPDLMLIDWMLPDMSGLELTRSLKRAKDTEEIPVIMLTARAEEQDKVGGLEGGADDYITKPFSPRELLARIQAVLRRAAPAGAADVVEADGLKLDDSSHRVSAGEREIALGPTEYRLLHFFMTHPERVLKLFAFAANSDPSGVADIAQSPVFNAFIARAEQEYEKLSPTPTEYKTFLAQIEKMWETQPNWTAADLHRVAVPVWIIDADHDEAIKRENTEFMAREIPNAGLLLQPEVSHFSFLQDPEQFTADMLHFLQHVKGR